jgi:signal transduction histidine kinase/CheY-like chemotaxis protein
MEQRTINEKNVRRLRVMKLMSWIGCVFAAGWGITQFLDPTPGMWKAATVNAVAALVFALIPQLARVAPFSATVTSTVFVYAYLFIIINLFGTGSGVPMYYLVLAGLVFATYGTERILLSAFFGVLAAALIVASEALVPRSTGLYTPALGFASFVAVSIATTALLMATVYYALRTSERAEEALALDNEIIQDKTRQLEMANKYKSHFLASASHDLRQPLHALGLFVAQLRDETNPAERSRLVGRIDAAVGSMNELFDALLDMTKLEAGILKTNLTELSVARLLERIETTFAGAARKKGLSLRVVGSDAWVSSDPILLERILLNLVSNAVRYTERGGVMVGCRRRGKELRIDVFDTGAGIPEEQRQRIFGEFYQMAGPGPDRNGGLGLGLAIVDRLARLLGHKVELESRPGRGSRFSVTVPLAAQPHAATETSATPLAIADPARGKRIIVIDDDALVLDGMRGILQSWGCQVEMAASGDAALACLGQNGEPPDLIISDSALANGKTGTDAIRRLRQAVGAPVPAFLITGDTAPERLREASAAGFHVLHKPVAPMALRATLNSLLNTSARSQPVSSA